MEKLISPTEKVSTGNSTRFGNGEREISPVDGDESASDSLEDALFSDSDQTPSEVSSDHEDGMSDHEEPVDGQRDTQAEEEIVAENGDQENVEERDRVREIPRPTTMTSEQMKKHRLQCHANYDPG